MAESFATCSREAAVRLGESVLPPKGCTGLDGEKRQIDASFKIGSQLLLVECKVFARSLAFERGDRQAVEYRCKRLEAALSEADEKAHWLRAHPHGTNYDIRECEGLLPVAVTPFVAFIPALNQWYWIQEGLPRVMTPDELAEFLVRPDLAGC